MASTVQSFSRTGAPDTCDAPVRAAHIAMVVYSVYETDSRVMQYANALAGRGDHVDVIALRGDGQASRGVVSGVNVFRVQTRPKGKQEGRVGYAARVLLFFLRVALLLARNSLRARYDVVHVHSVPDFLVFSALAPRLTGARIILDIHDLLPEFYKSRFHLKSESLLMKALLAEERLSAAFADYVLAPNHLWREKLISRSAHPDRCTVVLNYPDRSIFHPRSVERKSDKFVILFPGSLNGHQGVDLAIQAFARISGRVQHAEFHIYGEGPARAELAALIQTLNLQDRVFLHYWLPLTEIALVMSGADLAVVPKRADTFGNEAFSTKILEFMALGVPVIAADTRIDKYYFNDSVLRFFGSGEVDSLAAAMLDLIQNPEARASLRRNALELVDNYDWSRRKAEYLQIVDVLRGVATAPTN